MNNRETLKMLADFSMRFTERLAEAKQKIQKVEHLEACLKLPTDTNDQTND